MTKVPVGFGSNGRASYLSEVMNASDDDDDDDDNDDDGDEEMENAGEFGDDNDVSMGQDDVNTAMRSLSDEFVQSDSEASDEEQQAPDLATADSSSDSEIDDDEDTTPAPPTINHHASMQAAPPHKASPSIPKLVLVSGKNRLTASSAPSTSAAPPLGLAPPIAGPVKNKKKKGGSKSKRKSHAAEGEGGAPKAKRRKKTAFGSPRRIRKEPKGTAVLKKKDLLTVLKRSIATLKARDSYGFFLEPVPTDVVTDYLTVIKKPMDLGTMEKKVQARKYTNFRDFMDDFDLVIKNAKTYNAPETLYYKTADKLAQYGYKYLEREEQAVDESMEPPPPPPDPAPLPPRPTTPVETPAMLALKKQRKSYSKPKDPSMLNSDSPGEKKKRGKYRTKQSIEVITATRYADDGSCVRDDTKNVWHMVPPTTPFERYIHANSALFRDCLRPIECHRPPTFFDHDPLSAAPGRPPLPLKPPPSQNPDLFPTMYGGAKGEAYARSLLHFANGFGGLVDDVVQDMLTAQTKGGILLVNKVEEIVAQAEYDGAKNGAVEKDADDDDEIETEWGPINVPEVIKSTTQPEHVKEFQEIEQWRRDKIRVDPLLTPAIVGHVDNHLTVELQVAAPDALFRSNMQELADLESMRRRREEKGVTAVSDDEKRVRERIRRRLLALVQMVPPTELANLGDQPAASRAPKRSESVSQTPAAALDKANGEVKRVAGNLGANAVVTMQRPPGQKWQQQQQNTGQAPGFSGQPAPGAKFYAQGQVRPQGEWREQHRRHRPHGYRGLFPDTVIQSTIPRPHRKDLLVKPGKRPTSRGGAGIGNRRVATGAPEQVHHTMFAGADFITFGHQEQSILADVIDCPFVPNTRMPCVIKRRLPLSYEAQLRDMDHLVPRLRSEPFVPFKQEEEKEDVEPAVKEGAVVGLKFNEEVEKCFSDWPYDIRPRSDVYKEPEDILNSEERRAEASRRARAAAANADLVKAQRSNIKKDEKINDLNQNVQYMLDIYQKAEGIDLSAMLAKLGGETDGPHRRAGSHGRELEGESRHDEEEQDVRFDDEVAERTISPSRSSVSALELPEQTTTPRPSEAKDRSESRISVRSVQISPRVHNVPDQASTEDRLTDMPTLSRPSTALHRAVSRSRAASIGKQESVSGSQSDANVLERLISNTDLLRAPALPPVVPPNKRNLSNSTVRLLKKLAKETQPDDINATLKNTLTGADVTEMVSVYMPQRGYGKVPTVETRRAGVRKKKNYKLNAEGKVSVDMSWGGPQDGDFLFSIPDVEPGDDDDANSEYDGFNFMKHAPDRGEMGKSYTPVNGAAAGQDDVQNIIDIINSNTHHLHRHSHIPRFDRAAFAKTRQSTFSIAKLVTIIQRIYRKNPVARPPPSRLSTPGIVNSTEEPPLVENLSQFLDSTAVHLTEPPTSETIEYKTLFQTLMICLHEDNQELRYEAARILIAINGQWTLPRWDRIAFRNTLIDMLKSPNSDESFLAGKTLCDMGVVDHKSLRRLKQGLGDVDQQRRDITFDTLSYMNVDHAPILMETFLAEIENTSWKARVDVVRLLEVWLMRLRPPKEVDIDDSTRPAHTPDGPVTPRSAPLTPGSTRNSTLNVSAMASQEKLSAFATTIVKKSVHDLSVIDSPFRTAPGLRATTDDTQDGERVHTSLRKLSKMLKSGSDMQLQEKKHIEALCQRAIEALLTLMWNDWAPEVRTAAGLALMNMGEGRSMFEWIVGLLQSADPTKRIDALKCLAGLGFITPAAMASFMRTFDDSYATVRIEACKVACSMSMDNRDLLNMLLKRLDDPDSRVRRYAVKAIGVLKCKEPRIKEALHWCLDHDRSGSVRSEAIRATKELNLVLEDQSLRDSILTIMEMDRVEEVRREAERVLIMSGVISDVEGKLRGISTFAAAADESGEEHNTEARSAGEGGETPPPDELPQNRRENTVTVAAVPGMINYQPNSANAGGTQANPSAPAKMDPGFRITTMTGNLPGPLAGHTQEEVEIYFRESLVGEPEQRAVIDQVKEMAAAQNILFEVAKMELESPRLPDSGLDLDLHKPLKFDFKKKRRKALRMLL
ncbi:HEAT repeat-containing protein 4 [Irineochytrium annulatum]|nr:HEAT repeat-containing protein 4 [Irineochytrium annulatum]